jgi:hypothetical protein
MKLNAAIFIASLVVPLIGAPSATRGAPTPGPNVNVSVIAGSQSEVGIALNPTDPLNIVVVANELSDLSKLGVWYSFDGGATWTPSFIDEVQDGLGAADSRFDPNVAFDSDGNVYVVYSTSGSDNRLMLARSGDGGQNFTQVTTVTTDTPTASNLHTAMVTTRADAGGADDVLVLWSRVIPGDDERLQAALSLDAGTTFTVTNNSINDAIERTFVAWAVPDAFGDFHVVWEVDETGGAGSIYHDVLDGVTLADGSPNNFVTSIEITDFADATSRIPAQPDRGIFSVATVDVDRVTGRIYISYTDRPDTSSDDTDIYVRFSDDGGVTWSARDLINDDGTTTSQFMPRLSVDQILGDIYVIWYDARNDTTNNQRVDIFATISTDGGVTWSANMQVTDAASDESTANAARDTRNYLEYIGLSANDGIAYVGWTDARDDNFTNGTNEDVYVAFLATDAPPFCDANGPYIAECGVALALDGLASFDPDGGALSLSWIGPMLPSPAAGATPMVTFPTPTGLKFVDLTVQDDEGDSAMCMAAVTVEDTLDPDLTIPDDVTAECTGPAGTPVDIGMAAVTDLCDPSVDIANNAPALFPLGDTNVTWTATDDDNNQSTDVQVVTVEDTTEPEIFCNAPATITPPDAPLSFTATAEDICAGPLTPTIVAFDCFKHTNKGRRIDKTESCVVTLDGDTVTIADSGGVGTTITWTVEVADPSGNMHTETCQTNVVNPAI